MRALCRRRWCVARAEGGERPPRSQARERWVAVSVRDKEVFRYKVPSLFASGVLPDFFPAFNPTPLEAKRDAGVDDRADGAPDTRRSTYRWKRSVLAGVEASEPARERPATRTPVASPAPPEEPGGTRAVSYALLVTTVLCYGVAFALTFARAFVDGGGPAPVLEMN